MEIEVDPDDLVVYCQLLNWQFHVVIRYLPSWRITQIYYFAFCIDFLCSGYFLSAFLSLLSNVNQDGIYH